MKLIYYNIELCRYWYIMAECSEFLYGIFHFYHLIKSLLSFYTILSNNLLLL